MKKWVISASMVLLMSVPGYTQDIFKVHLGWFDWTGWAQLTSNVKLGGDTGYRTTYKGFSYHTYYFRPTLSWKLNRLVTANFAVSTFRTWNNESIDLQELRFAEEALIRWPELGRFRFNHRIRFEHRYFYINPNKENAHRMRYRFAVHFPEFHVLNIPSLFYYEVTWEDFIQLGSSYINPIGNQHRWEVMLGNRISEDFKISLHYIWQTTRARDEPFILQENIIRLRFTNYFNR